MFIFVRGFYDAQITLTSAVGAHVVGGRLKHFGILKSKGYVLSTSS